MSAFLKIDRCAGCQRELSWEWVPPVEVGGRTLPGTGVWRSSLVDELCAGCAEARAAVTARSAQARTKRERLVALLGGMKPFREFTFERFKVHAGNRAAFESALHFDPDLRNLYLWGASGVGKTHLAYAIARRAFWMGRSVTVTTPGRLIRTLRMKPPEEEQRAIDAVVFPHVVVLDGLGRGGDTPYTRQILHKTLDARDFQDRRGLVVTSRLPPTQLVHSCGDDGVASRLAGMCRVVQVKGIDGRLLAP
jgi:DNA replication protein DnaC